MEKILGKIAFEFCPIAFCSALICKLFLNDYDCELATVEMRLICQMKNETKGQAKPQNIIFFLPHTSTNDLNIWPCLHKDGHVLLTPAPNLPSMTFQPLSRRGRPAEFIPHTPSLKVSSFYTTPRIYSKLEENGRQKTE